jgi:hypothetical protein
MKIKEIMDLKPVRNIDFFKSAKVFNSESMYFYNENGDIFIETSDKTGMGGRNITLETDIGTVTLKGPWMSNPRDMKKFTGVDISKNEISFGLIFSSRRDALDFEIGYDRQPLFADIEWMSGDAEERMAEVIESKFSHLQDVQIMTVYKTGGSSIKTHYINK